MQLEHPTAAITGTFLRCTNCAPLSTHVRRLYGPKTGDILLLFMYALKNQVNRPVENMRLKLSMRLKVSCA